MVTALSHPQESYGADAILAGSESVYVPLVPPTYEFDPARLEAAFADGAKALVLCNPSNPSGKVFTKSELTTIAELACAWDAYVITDEVYEHIVYAPNTHTHIATYPGVWERTISYGSLEVTPCPAHRQEARRAGRAIASA